MPNSHVAKDTSAGQPILQYRRPPRSNLLILPIRGLAQHLQYAGNRQYRLLAVCTALEHKGVIRVFSIQVPLKEFGKDALYVIVVRQKMSRGDF